MKLLSILSTCAVLAASPALADSRIAWGDLDLSTAPGAAALDARIDAAARRACSFKRKPNSWISDFFDCKAAFRAEALSLLPEAAQAAYAVGRRTST
ncbi:UrcA family protein [Roseibacterium beibuensis]|uniref:UrcA family protein n=1 Tax=[Roseibacterium] beibuensis TaxID=1193142 RepID=UPI00217DE20A|nr:UrcA family protein [Roseibacterium beibuensis]MCS6625432.1 UrcA family protein [Roseibacterium beibuensis]